MRIRAGEIGKWLALPDAFAIDQIETLPRSLNSVGPSRGYSLPLKFSSGNLPQTAARVFIPLLYPRLAPSGTRCRSCLS